MRPIQKAGYSPEQLAWSLQVSVMKNKKLFQIKRDLRDITSRRTAWSRTKFCVRQTICYGFCEDNCGNLNMMEYQTMLRKITNDISCDNDHLAMQDNVLIFKRCILKYLEVNVNVSIFYFKILKYKHRVLKKRQVTCKKSCKKNEYKWFKVQKSRPIVKNYA